MSRHGTRRFKVVRLFLLFLCGALLSGPPAAAQPEPKKIVLIGATAVAAPELINRALDAGHIVIGFARRPEAVEINHERFSVVKGDVYEVETIEAALNGDEIVVSYIDVAMTLDEEDAAGIDLFSKGTANIVAAMKAKGNERLIVASAVGAEHIILEEPSADASMSERFVWLRRHKYDDIRRMEMIVEGSELDFIILRLPHLVGGPPGDAVNIVVNANTYNAAVRDAEPARPLTRADLSDFILQNLEADTYVGKTVGLYN